MSLIDTAVQQAKRTGPNLSAGDAAGWSADRNGSEYLSEDRSDAFALKFLLEEVLSFRLQEVLQYKEDEILSIALLIL